MRYSNYFAASFLLYVITLPCYAQQQDAAPKQAIYAMPGLSDAPNGAAQDVAPPDMNPDRTSLTGAQDFTVGTPGLRHSYWVPGLTLENSFQSSYNGSQDWVSTSHFVGTASLNIFSSHSQFALNYSGGGSVTNSNSVPDGYYHNLNTSQSFTWKRWTLAFLDEFSYLPQSTFGFGGVSNLGSPGVGGVLGSIVPGLQTNYSLAQSLFSSTDPRFNNSAVVQTEYALTARSSLTTTASYGILRFTQGNSIETNDEIFSLGYNYQVTKNDTIGAVYRFTNYRFLGDPQALNDHVANLAYGRKITGRLALQLFGGPEINTFRHPIGTETERVSFSAGGLVTYAFRQGGLSITYNHGLSAGSGVLIGSVRDEVGSRFSFPISRRWNGSTGLGYALNKPISGSVSPVGSQSLHSLYASGGLNYALSRNVKVNVNYTFDYQDSTQLTCPAGGCGTNYMQHQIWVGFDWHTRPFVLR